MYKMLCPAACLLVFASFFQSANAQDAPPTLDDFLADTTFWSPELSPNGNHVAGIRRMDDETVLILADLDAADAAPEAIRMKNTRLNWIEWITDERMLLSLTTYVSLRNGALLPLDNLTGEGVYAAPLTRVMAMNRDGSQKAAMFNDDRRMNKSFYLGGVVDFLVDQPDHILMAARRGGDLDLFKVNVMDGSFERVAVGTEFTFRWFVDRKGQPAFRYDSNLRGTVISIFAREDRANGKIKWRKIKTIRKKRAKEKSATEFKPLFVGPTETTYYVAARPEGKNTTGIYLYDFEKDSILEALKTHPEIDIENAFFNRSTREIQGFYYFDDKLEIEYLDAQTQVHLNGLNAYFGNEANVVPMRSSRDGKRWLIWASGPQDPGSYHVYDLEKKFAQQIANRKQSLIGKQLAPMQTIRFRARDDLELRGYLTRPPGIADDAKPPLVLLPHGGPESRDVFGYNERVQVLAANGYQVFQPNFRGSAGFGKAFVDKGHRQWGKAMQTDIDDAYTHLVEAGFAKEGNVCIMGGSYGGYAALVAATLTPELYRCAISIAGVSDLEKQLKYERKESGRKSKEYLYWVAQIGDPKKDKDAIRAISPAKLADRVNIPILLIHGENDGVVPDEQSLIMQKALTKAGKDVRYVSLPNSRHSSRGEGEKKKEYMEILDFLRAHLPVAAAQTNQVSEAQ